MKNLTTILFALLSTPLLAQNFIVKPYLQNASPSSITIMWETDFGDDSVVKWGLDTSVENTTTSIATSTPAGHQMHSVELSGLDRFTNYYYKVVTGLIESDIHMFKTPPFASDNEDFRFVAMSDMQQSWADPEIFDEVIHDGVLDYLDSMYGGETADNLALVLIPGDLVDYGNTYNQWEEDFFDPASDLLESVPLYPVLGNHEANTSYYFQYFKLPENGTEEYEEHWWWKDYGNVRFIGLNSNSPYNGDEQLNWLDNILNSTCSADSIDFVFAELHHPHKSELWTPGESVFSGDVVEKLENFSTQCGKPSVHFFGHTHGYSRGQSRDHKHVWLNVATAGGAIDYWGEWPQFDYEEFTVSEDDWGFVMVDVEAGDEPKFTIKRLSRGDNYVDLDNEEIDRLTVTKLDYEISTPTPQYPVGTQVPPECVILTGSEFDTVDMHGATHWQVTSNQGNYINPIVDIWEQHQNLYFNEDTQEGESLIDEHIHGLEANSQYWWRVRYRDKELNWSTWSEEVEFSTGNATFSVNLLSNHGSESLLENWIIDEGICESMLAGDCEGTDPYNGNRYFAVGGLCQESPIGRMHQDMDVSIYADSIDSGQMQVRYGAMMSDWSGADIPDMKLDFYNQSNNLISSTDYIPGAQTTWLLIQTSEIIPPLTRTIRCELRGTRNEGTDNDCYFDDVFVRIGSEVDCSEEINNFAEIAFGSLNFNAYPNPALEKATISLPNSWGSETSVRLVDSMGSKIDAKYDIENSTLTLHRSNHRSGTYTLIIINENQWGSTKIVFE
tara:strand:- start:4096 stop:6444 length:2349 start_codon:yes stop_codon:yes gene_type:complete